MLIHWTSSERQHSTINLGMNEKLLREVADQSSSAPKMFNLPMRFNYFAAVQIRILISTANYN